MLATSCPHLAVNFTAIFYSVPMDSYNIEVLFRTRIGMRTERVCLSNLLSILGGKINRGFRARSVRMSDSGAE